MKKYTNIIVLAIALLVVVFTISFGIYEYRREHAFRVDILHSQLQLNNYHFLEGKGDSTIRVTVMDTLGNVQFDSQERDISRMGNHLYREEIQQALDEGKGFAIKRTSETNGEMYFYSATRFEKQIIRSAVPYSAPLTSSLERDYTFFYYTFGILALIAIVLYLRHRLHRSEADKQRIKRQLTENAAHELKTPAATIEGYLETLTSTPDMPQEKQMLFIRKCYAQSQRMSRLLQDMSTLTRLDEAHIVRPETPVDLSQLLMALADEMHSSFENKGMELNLQIPERMVLPGDNALLYSLFSNIFSNAVAYASGATRFTVSGKQEISGWVITLSDNGQGVPAPHLPHIFERFYRIDKGRSRRMGGTGLGLAIVKNIALQYGGGVEASETPGGGLTITVTLR